MPPWKAKGTVDACRTVPQAALPQRVTARYRGREACQGLFSAGAPRPCPPRRWLRRRTWNADPPPRSPGAGPPRPPPYADAPGVGAVGRRLAQLPLFVFPSSESLRPFCCCLVSCPFCVCAERRGDRRVLCGGRRSGGGERALRAPPRGAERSRRPPLFFLGGPEATRHAPGADPRSLRRSGRRHHVKNVPHEKAGDISSICFSC